MKLLAVVVIYKPDLVILVKGLLSLLGESDKVLLYQNSKLSKSDKDFIYTFLGSEFLKSKIDIVGNGENIGVSGALNYAVFRAINEDFTHLLTMDQDSYFGLGYLKKFKHIINSNHYPNIGIYSPNIVVNNVLSYPLKEDGPYYEPDTITSGSIFPVDILKRFKGFDDFLFIDGVDYDFCYRVFKGEKLFSAVFSDVKLHQMFGYPKKIKFGLTTSNYSAFRTYYIIRNHIVIWRRYPSSFRRRFKVTLIRVHIIERCVKIVLGEEDKINKLKAIVRGIIHGLLIKDSND